MNVLLKVVYTYNIETHNGLTELLEILSSITSGLTTPLKPEHATFFKKVLIPLHKVKTLATYNTQLQLCTKNYLEKSNQLHILSPQSGIHLWLGPRASPFSPLPSISSEQNYKF